MGEEKEYQGDPLEKMSREALAEVFGESAEVLSVDYYSVEKYSQTFVLVAHLKSYDKDLTIAVWEDQLTVSLKAFNPYSKSDYEGKVSSQELTLALGAIKYHLDNPEATTVEILSAPLTEGLADVQVVEIQSKIKDTIPKPVNFSDLSQSFRGNELEELSFSVGVRSQNLRTSFHIRLTRQGFQLLVDEHLKKNAQDFKHLQGDVQPLNLQTLTQSLEEFNACLRVLEWLQFQAMHEKGQMREPKTAPVLSDKPSQSDEKPQQAPDNEDKQLYLGLRKLVNLELILTVLLVIGAGALEVYMASQGYPGSQVRVNHSRAVLHSYAFFFAMAYFFLVYPSAAKAKSLAKAHPEWPSLKSKGAPFPLGYSLWAFCALLLVLIMGYVDFSSRKPEPKPQKIDVSNVMEFHSWSREAENSSLAEIVKDINSSDSSSSETNPGTSE